MLGWFAARVTDTGDVYTVLAAMILTIGTFAHAGADAARALIADYYDGAGRWRACDRAGCPAGNSDWGDDSATGALYLRWRATDDPRLAAIAGQLAATSLRFPRPCDRRSCGYWSDTAAWDAVASMREFEMTGDARALARARAAYRFAEVSTAFSGGACPQVPYQQAPSPAGVKTLETLANEVKAGLLIYRATHDPALLQTARLQYAAARAYFLNAANRLYTVHIVDDGTRCVPVAQRYFASVNGLMIWNGAELAADTKRPSYLEQAVQTAQAVDTQLSDGAGIFADTGGENDVVEPLVEGMLRLARTQPFALSWIERNAQAALGSRSRDGSFARFFDGPPQHRASIWESNGGFAIEIAAATVAPAVSLRPPAAWTAASLSAQTIQALPVTISIEGSAVALYGDMSPACEYHHVQIYVDGVEIHDHAGIWLNPSMPENDPVLFAWRWSTPGEHTITLVSSDTTVALTQLIDP